MTWAPLHPRSIYTKQTPCASELEPTLKVRAGDRDRGHGSGSTGGKAMLQVGLSLPRSPGGANGGFPTDEGDNTGTGEGE